MKPEPSDCDWNSRGPPGFGVKRRKNSKNGSSSGTFGNCCASGLRAPPCVVLILTTAGPCFSTISVKSGSCATDCSGNNRQITHNTFLIMYSPVNDKQ